MTPEERAVVIDLLDESEERLRGMAAKLSTDQLGYRPDDQTWSIADNIEHLVIVEKRLIGAIGKLIQQPADQTKKCALTDSEVLRQVGTVIEKVQAPDRSLPKSQWPPDQLLSEFESTRKQTREFASTVEGDLRSQFIAHFVFGELDCYQWLLLIGAHCNRHRLQSEALMTNAAFPRQSS